MTPQHSDLVQELHHEHPPAKTLEGALAFLLVLISRLQRLFPQERVGLLIKTAGENIVSYGGTSVSAGRIVYPDHDLLVKVLTDIPSTNGPSWQIEEGIPSTGHDGGYLAVPNSGTTLPHPGTPSPDLSGILTRLSLLETRAGLLWEVYAELVKQIGLINQAMAALDVAVVRQPLPDYAGKLGPWTITSRPKT